jgi:uncharacterized protein (DUF58 family)
VSWTPIGTQSWTPSTALPRAVIVVLVLLVLAVVGGRVDLAVLAAPFVLGTALALWRRPRQSPSAVVKKSEEPVVEGGDIHVSVQVRNPDDATYDFVVMRSQYSTWLELHRGREVFAASVGGSRMVDLPLPGKALRWGWLEFGPVRVNAVACDGLFHSEELRAEPALLRVFPRTQPFSAHDAMPRAAGLVGVHRSRRYGDGGELAGIRQFMPGDRLRRIDWRASLRAGELHVAQTLSDRDAELVVLVDVLHEAGPSGGIEGAPSVLDTSVRAAAGISQHFLGRGDRVMLVEYGGRGRTLRAGSGRKQYLAILEWLLGVRSGERRYGPSASVFGMHRVPSSSLLVVLTPLLDTRSVEMMARLARSGRPVVAVDTLPDSVRPPRRNRWTEVAYRIWLLERQNTISRLLAHGVPTVTWAGAGSLDNVLRDVSRMAAAPR